MAQLIEELVFVFRGQDGGLAQALRSREADLNRLKRVAIDINRELSRGGNLSRDLSQNTSQGIPDTGRSGAGEIALSVGAELTNALAQGIAEGIEQTELAQASEALADAARQGGDGGGVLDAVGGILGGTLGNVATGTFQGVGRDISSRLSAGITESIDEQLAPVVGSTELLGRAIADRAAEGIRNATDAVLGDELLENISAQVTNLVGGQDVVDREALLTRAQANDRDFGSTQIISEQATQELRATLRAIDQQSAADTQAVLDALRSRADLVASELAESLARNPDALESFINQKQEEVEAIARALTSGNVASLGFSDEAEASLAANTSQGNIEALEVILADQRARAEQIEALRERARAERQVLNELISEGQRPQALVALARDTLGDNADLSRLPSLEVDQELLDQRGANATFQALRNRIVVSNDLYDAVLEGSLTPDQAAILAEEIAHAADLDFGSASGLQRFQNNDIARESLEAGEQALEDYTNTLEQLGAYPEQVRDFEESAKTRAQAAAARFAQRQESTAARDFAVEAIQQLSQLEETLDNASSGLDGLNIDQLDTNATGQIEQTRQAFQQLSSLRQQLTQVVAESAATGQAFPDNAQAAIRAQISSLTEVVRSTNGLGIEQLYSTAEAEAQSALRQTNLFLAQVSQLTSEINSNPNVQAATSRIAQNNTGRDVLRGVSRGASAISSGATESSALLGAVSSILQTAEAIVGTTNDAAQFLRQLTEDSGLDPNVQQLVVQISTLTNSLQGVAGRAALVANQGSRTANRVSATASQIGAAAERPVSTAERAEAAQRDRDVEVTVSGQIEAVPAPTEPIQVQVTAEDLPSVKLEVEAPEQEASTVDVRQLVTEADELIRTLDRGFSEAYQGLRSALDQRARDLRAGDTEAAQQNLELAQQFRSVIDQLGDASTDQIRDTIAQLRESGAEPASVNRLGGASGRISRRRNLAERRFNAIEAEIASQSDDIELDNLRDGVRNVARATNEKVSELSNQLQSTLNRIQEINAEVVQPRIAEAQDATRRQLNSVRANPVGDVSPTDNTAVLDFLRSTLTDVITPDLIVNTAGFTGSQIAPKILPILLQQLGADIDENTAALVGDFGGALAARLSVSMATLIRDSFEQVADSGALEDAGITEQINLVLQQTLENLNPSNVLGGEGFNDFAGFAIGNAAANIPVPLSGAATAIATVPRVAEFRENVAAPALNDLREAIVNRIRSLEADAVKQIEDDDVSLDNVNDLENIRRRVAEATRKTLESAVVGIDQIARLVEQNGPDISNAAQESLGKLTEALRELVAIDPSEGAAEYQQQLEELQSRVTEQLEQLIEGTVEEVSSGRELSVPEVSELVDQGLEAIDQIFTERVEAVQEQLANIGQADFDAVEDLAERAGIQNQVAANQSSVGRILSQDVVSPEDFQELERLENEIRDIYDLLDLPVPDIGGRIGAEAREAANALESAEDSAQGFTQAANAISAVSLGGLAAGATTLAGALGLLSNLDLGNIQGFLFEAAQGFAAVDASLGALGVTSDATEEELAAVTATVGRLARSTSQSGQEIADAALEMARAGFSAEQVTASLDGVVLSAEATGEDLLATSEVIGATLTQFGLFSDDIAETQRASAGLADLFTVASNVSASGTVELGQALQFTAVQAVQTGQDVEETVKVLALLSQAGINGSQAGTGLAEALRRLSNISALSSTELEGLSGGSERAQEAFRILNAEIRGADGQLLPLTQVISTIRTQLNAIESPGDQGLILDTLFGAQGGRTIGSLLNLTDEQISEILGGFDDLEGQAASTAAALQEGLAGSLDLFDASLSAARNNIGALVAIPLDPAVRAATELVNAFVAIPQPVQIATLAVTGLGGAFIAAVAAITAYRTLQIGTIVEEVKAAAATVANTLSKDNLSRAISRVNALTGANTVLTGQGTAATAANTAATNAFSASAGRAAASLGLIAAAFASVAAAGSVYQSLTNAAPEAEEATRNINDALDDYLERLEEIPGTERNAFANRLRDENEDPRTKRLREIREELNFFESGLDKGLRGLQRLDNAVQLPFRNESQERFNVGTLSEGILNNEIATENEAVQAAGNIVSNLRSTIFANLVGSSGEERELARQLIDSALAEVNGVDFLDEQTGEQADRVADEIRALQAELDQYQETLTSTGNASSDFSLAELEQSFNSAAEAAEAAEAAALNAIAAEELAGNISGEEADQQRAAAAEQRLTSEVEKEREILEVLREKAAAEEDGSRLAELSREIREREASLLESETGLLEEQIQNRAEANEKALADVEQRIAQELAQVERGEQQKLLAISQAEAAGTLSAEEAAAQREQLTVQRIEAEIAQERKRIAQLSAIELGGENSEERESAILAAEGRILQLQIDSAQQAAAAREAAEQRALQAVQESQKAALEEVRAAESERNLLIAERELQLRQQGTAQADIERAIAEESLESRRESLNEELRIQEAFIADLEALPQNEDTEDQIRQAKAETNRIAIDLVQAEIDAQDQLTQRVLDNIDRQQQRQQTAADAAIASINRQATLAEAQAGLRNAIADAEEAGLQNQASEAEGQERLQLEIQLAELQRRNLEQRQEAERQALQFAQQRAQVEAQIALAQSRADLARAEASGSTEEELNALRLVVGLNQQQLTDLAQLQDLERQTLDVRQDIAVSAAEGRIGQARDSLSDFVEQARARLEDGGNSGGSTGSRQSSEAEQRRRERIRQNEAAERQVFSTVGARETRGLTLDQVDQFGEIIRSVTEREPSSETTESDAQAGNLLGLSGAIVAAIESQTATLVGSIEQIPRPKQFFRGTFGQAATPLGEGFTVAERGPEIATDPTTGKSVLFNRETYLSADNPLIVRDAAETRAILQRSPITPDTITQWVAQQQASHRSTMPQISHSIPAQAAQMQMLRTASANAPPRTSETGGWLQEIAGQQAEMLQQLSDIKQSNQAAARGSTQTAAGMMALPQAMRSRSEAAAKALVRETMQKGGF